MRILSAIAAGVLFLQAAAPVLASAGDALLRRAAERRAERLAERRQGRGGTHTSSQTEETARDFGVSAAVNAATLRAKREARREARLADLKGERTEIRRRLLSATNAARARHGLPPLTVNDKLQLAAQRHAEDMQQRNFFAHENPDGAEPIDRIKRTGYGDVSIEQCRCQYRFSVGENIARGQDTVTQVLEQWLASPGHRAKILSPEYKEIGIGLVGRYWVQEFGLVEIEPLDGHEELDLTER